jgi:hypothetical protein
MLVELFRIAAAEAKARYRLIHPNILVHHGVSLGKSEFEMLVMLVMEHCPHTLHDYITGYKKKKLHLKRLATSSSAQKWRDGGRDSSEIREHRRGQSETGEIWDNGRDSGEIWDSGRDSGEIRDSGGFGSVRMKSHSPAAKLERAEDRKGAVGWLDSDMSWWLKTRLLIQVADAMAYLQQDGIAHTDLHPGNVHLTAKLDVKLTGFGERHLASRLLVGLRAETNGDTNDAHSVGMREGGVPDSLVLAYMAPELMTKGLAAAENVQNEQAAIYAFGVTMWACMTRARPYDSEQKALSGSNIWVLRSQIARGKRPEVSTNPALLKAPTALLQLMRECWEADPAKRPFGGFAAIKHRLMQLQEELSQGDMLQGDMSQGEVLQGEVFSDGKGLSQRNESSAGTALVYPPQLVTCNMLLSHTHTPHGTQLF